MIDVTLLGRATLVGIILQVALVVLAHFLPWIAFNALMFGRMCIAGVAGLFYARDLNGGWLRGTVGATIAGTVCAAVGVWISVVLRDMPAPVVPFAVLASALSAFAGGPFGQMAANMRAASNTRR